MHAYVEEHDVRLDKDDQELTPTNCSRLSWWSSLGHFVKIYCYVFNWCASNIVHNIVSRLRPHPTQPQPPTPTATPTPTPPPPPKRSVDGNSEHISILPTLLKIISKSVYQFPTFGIRARAALFCIGGRNVGGYGCNSRVLCRPICIV